MKNKLLKKVIALTAVASMSVMGSVNIANADKITSLPYVNGFDGNPDQQYTSTFYDNNGNKLGVWQWYSPNGNDVLELTTDADAPERGKVTKLSINDVMDSYIRYDLGTQSTGKLLIKFDLKAQNQHNVSFVYRDAANIKDTYWRTLRMAANSVYIDEWTGLKNSTYTFNEYNTVKVLFDFDNDKVTTCFKGVMSESKLQYNSIPGFDIQYAASGATSRSDVIYIDNMEIRKISGTTVPVLTDGEGVEIGAYSPVADTLKLSLADGDTFETAPNATLIDLGANPVAVTEREIPVESELVNGAVTYYLDEELTAGNRYKLVIDDVKSAWMQNLSKTEFDFVCSETNGKIVTTYEEDFSGVEALNEQKSANSVYGDSKLTYFWVGSGGGAELLSDTDTVKYKGGKALKLNTNTHIGYRVADTNNGIKYGEIELEAHIIPTGWGNMKIGNDSVANHRFFQWGGEYFINYFQGPDGTSTYSRDKDSVNGKYNHNGDIVVKHKLNLEDKTYDVNVNGIDMDYDGKKYALNLLDSVSGAGNWLDKGAVFVKFTAEGENVIDYITFKHSIEAPTVTKITFVDKNGVEAQYVSGTTLSDVAAMKVYFNEAVIESKLSEIAVNGAKYTGSYDAENMVYTLTFTEDLAPGTNYTVSIPAGVVASNRTGTGSREVIEGTFKTYGVAAAASVKITNAEGNVIEDIADAGNTINIVAENVQSADNKVVIVYAGYNGGKLVEISFDELDVVSGTATYPATIKNKSGLTSIKAFVLEDMENVKPLCECEEI